MVDKNTAIENFEPVVKGKNNELTGNILIYVCVNYRKYGKFIIQLIGGRRPRTTEPSNNLLNGYVPMNIRIFIILLFINVILY